MSRCSGTGRSSTPGRWRRSAATTAAIRVRGLPGAGEDDAGKGGRSRSTSPAGTSRPRTLLEARNIDAKLHDVSFELRRGEILGFYGLVGAGKTEVARVLYGIDPYQGEILFEGSPAAIKSVPKALQAGITMIPEERGRTASSAAVDTGEHPHDADGEGPAKRRHQPARENALADRLHQEHVHGDEQREKKVASSPAATSRRWSSRSASTGRARCC